MGSLGYDDTPIIPGTPWHVHDGTRPQPPVVAPGSCCDCCTDCGPGTAPSDAVILLDGSSLAGWVGGDAKPARWKLEDGYIEVVPGTGNIQTVEHFGDCQLHLEWCAPTVVKGESQGRGNSGVFLMAQYEIQVLDCYDNPTYPDGTTGAIYGQYPPLANACRAPGEWQVYDIVWEGPRFEGESCVKPAYVTVILNGIVLHNHVELMGNTSHRVLTDYVAHPPTGPLMLQDHGDLVRFRNIWYRPLKGYDEE